MSKIKTDIQRLLTPPKHLEKLHVLFTLLLALFRTYNIFTLAMSGTLLGIVRNRDYILWDDDVDMAVNFSDYQRIMDLNIILHPRGIEIFSQGHRWESGKPWKVLKVRYRDAPHIFIDLFPFEFKGHTYRMAPKGHIPKSWYRRNVFKVNELFPLRLMKLRDLWVPVPNKAEGFINRSYGKESLDTCVITHQHLPPHKKKFLENLENSVEMLLGLGVYGKKFPCSLIPPNTLPLPPVSRLKWIHWLFFTGVVLFVVGMVLIFMTKKKGG